VYLVFEAIQGLTLWVLDVTPVVSADAYWRANIVGMGIESLVKLAVIWELFSHLVRQRPEVSRQGNWLIGCTALMLMFIAALAAVHAPIANYAILSRAWIFEQTIYLVQAGILLFMFLFAGSLHLAWDRRDFGIALGLSISACVGLGVFAICANGIFFNKRYLLDFLIMATYHACVVMWYYCLLVPIGPSLAVSRRLDSSAQTTTAQVLQP